VEEQLAGGIANGGAVTRIGDHVLRPANPHSETIHRFLSALHESGFEGAPKPLSIADGRERLEFVKGDVPLPPFPEWVQTDEALGSATALVRRFHDASRDLDLRGAAWSDEAADPEGGPVICHNDLCLENIVFRQGHAIALLDFDFAAPGPPASDVARFAGYCVPVDDDTDASRAGWAAADRSARLRLIADAYGLDAEERTHLISFLDRRIAQGGQWVLSKVQAGDVNFTRMWNQGGGMDRYDRRRRWWATNRIRMVAALR
jgi:Phosphotransferase enzyme family